MFTDLFVSSSFPSSSASCSHALLAHFLNLPRQFFLFLHCHSSLPSIPPILSHALITIFVSKDLFISPAPSFPPSSPLLTLFLLPSLPVTHDPHHKLPQLHPPLPPSNIISYPHTLRPLVFFYCLLYAQFYLFILLVHCFHHYFLHLYFLCYLNMILFLFYPGRHSSFRCAG